MYNTFYFVEYIWWYFCFLDYFILSFLSSNEVFAYVAEVHTQGSIWTERYKEQSNDSHLTIRQGFQRDTCFSNINQGNGCLLILKYRLAENKYSYYGYIYRHPDNQLRMIRKLDKKLFPYYHQQDECNYFLRLGVIYGPSFIN